MSTVFVLIAVVAWLAFNFWICAVARSLVKRAADLLRAEDDAIFPDRGPIEGGSVQYEQLPPSIEESPALAANILDEDGKPSFTVKSIEQAMEDVLRFGEWMRRCECHSTATHSELREYAVHPLPGDPSKAAIMAHVIQSCGECGRSDRYTVPPYGWIAMLAAEEYAKAEMSQDAIRLGLEREQDKPDD